MATPTTPATEALLRSLLDYAGLFPPARLDMSEAVSRYLRALDGSDHTMLGTFVLPLGRLDEFAEVVGRSSTPGRERLPVSLIVPAEKGSEVRSARERLAGVGVIGALEVPPSDASAVTAFADQVPDDVQVFHEVPHALAQPGSLVLDDEALRLLDAIALAGDCAKIRTGGLEATAFPSVFELAAFVEACRERGVPFKATAGLHHAVRGPHRTEGDHGPRVWMHGFLNLAIGSALLWAGKVTREELVEVLSESSIQVFAFDRRSLRWRDRELATDEIHRCRRGFYQSFGSCSFREPTGELAAAGWLEAMRRPEVRV